MDAEDSNRLQINERRIGDIPAMCPEKSRTGCGIKSSGLQVKTGCSRTLSGTSILDYDVIQFKEFGINIKTHEFSFEIGEKAGVKPPSRKDVNHPEVRGSRILKRMKSFNTQLIQRSMMKGYGFLGENNLIETNEESNS